LPDEVADLVREGQRLCEERDRAAGDHERWRDLAREVYYIAGRVGLELDRHEGRAVSQWRVDAVEQRRASDVPVVERIQEMAAPVPPPQIPEAIVAEVQRKQLERQGLIDNRAQQRRAFGRPSEAHCRWSELLGGRTL